MILRKAWAKRVQLIKESDLCAAKSGGKSDAWMVLLKDYMEAGKSSNVGDNIETLFCRSNRQSIEAEQARATAEEHAYRSKHYRLLSKANLIWAMSLQAVYGCDVKIDWIGRDCIVKKTKFRFTFRK